MNLPRLLLAAIGLLVAVSAAAAQDTPPATGQIRGHVIEARTAAPLAAVLVRVDATRQQAISGEDGTFVIDAVPAGKQSLLISVVGFGLVRRDVFVTGGETSELTIPVAEGASTYVEDVAVSASRFRETEPGAASQSVLGSRELLALRGVIADDPFRAVQVLPGVAAGDDYRGEFAVRGLGPYHVGLSIDEVDSRLLFHTVRGVSDTGSLGLINSDILEEATLLSGAHPQKLASHLGARLDFRTRDGARDRLHVRALVSGSATTTVWEGPLGDGTKGSWLVAGRKSYIDWILRRVDTSIDGTFGFTDAQAKLTLNPTPAQTVRFSIIGGYSELDEEDDAALNAFDRGRSHTLIGNLQWRLAPSPKWSLTQQLYIVDNRYRNRVSDGRSREEGGDRDITWRGGLAWSPGAQHLVEFGAQAQALHAERIDRRFTSATAAVTTIDARPSTSSQAGWLSYRWTPTARFSVSPGVRVERWQLLNQTAASPWMLAELQLAEATKLRGGVSMQRQAPGLDESLLARAGDTLRAERARVVDIGLEQRVGESWRVSATSYQRAESDRLRVINGEFRLVNNAIVRPSRAYIANVLDGTSRGLEFTLERRSQNGVSGWVSYAVGKSENTDVRTDETYAADWDQRHTLNANVAYRWSEKSSVAARYRYGSNFPLQGYYAPLGEIHVLTSERNIGRLPTYSRLDMRADRAFNFRRSRLTLFAEVVNVMKRDNFRTQGGSLDLRTGQIFGLTEKLFPLLPSAGILIEF
ncbi:MAG TPA: carboxypeptidase-like regulatory domain-containing protein [Vicinamibacterales bacterium]|nr:carboxypeptidase-like regulatory domain-containing protein [Vicinamibacterales bacterium]